MLYGFRVNLWHTAIRPGSLFEGHHVIALSGALSRSKPKQTLADGTSSHPSRADDQSKSRYEKQEPDYDSDKLEDKDD